MTTLLNIGAQISVNSAITVGFGSVWDNKDRDPQKTPFYPAVQPHIMTGYSDTGLTGSYSSLFIGGQLPEHFANIEGECEGVFSNLTPNNLPCLDRKGNIVYPISATDILGKPKPKAAMLCEQQLRFLELAQYIYSVYGHMHYIRMTEEGETRLTEFGIIPFDLVTEAWEELIMEDGSTLEGENDQDIRITEDTTMGAFATTLVVDNPDRFSLGNPDANSWIYRIDNRYACAMMYQCRPIESMCRLVLLRHQTDGWADVVAMATDIAVNFLNWFSATWEDRTIDPPTDLLDPQVGEPISKYQDPHIAALMIKSGIFLEDAGLLSVDSSFFSDLFTFMDSVFIKNIGTRMEGTWATKYPDDSVYYFSYWHGEIIQTLSMLAKSPHFGISPDLCKSRLRSSAEWLKKYGVFSDAETEMEGFDYYNGYLVLSHPIDESLDMSSVFNRNIDILDNKITHPEIVDTANAYFKRQSLGYTLLNRNDILWMKEFFDSRKGRLKPFLLPSFSNDFILIERMVATDKSIKIKKGSDVDNGDIAIKLSSGEMLYNTIVGFSEFSDHFVLNLQAPVGVNADVFDVDYICYMNLSRLDQDRLELSYSSNTTAQTTLNVITDLNIRREENVYF